ncbi:S-adenosylmethionine decarboxylase [Gemmatimonadota bacterium]
MNNLEHETRGFMNNRNSDAAILRDIQPQVIRQRLIIEGTTNQLVDIELIHTYLISLSENLSMHIKDGPVTYSAEELPVEGTWSSPHMGYAGWLYWVSSGVHFHSYPTAPPIFSVDAYTCKPIDVEAAVEFTRSFFNPMDLVWLEIMPGNP